MANERIVLMTPIAQPSIANYKPVSLFLSVAPPQIVGTVLGTDGRGKVYAYPAVDTSLDTPAKVLVVIEALNTANLTTRSLWRRFFDKVVADFPADFPGGATVA